MMRFNAKHKARLVAGLCCFLAGVLAIDGVSAQSTRDLDNRIRRLENEIQTLNRAVYKGETPPPSFSNSGNAQVQASAEVRMQQLETEIRTLTGQIEEKDFRIRQLEEKLERALSDLTLRVEDVEKGGASTTSRASQYISRQPEPAAGTSGQEQPQGNSGSNYEWSSTSSDTATTTASLVGSGSPAAAYENAFSLLKNNQFDAAEIEFQKFVDAHPDHVLAGNAQYWLGETHYVRNQFETAARIFAEAYQKYPKSAKAPDNLLKLGMSLSGMGRKDDACTAFGQLKSEYAGTAVPVIRRADQEMSRIGCS